MIYLKESLYGLLSISAPTSEYALPKVLPKGAVNKSITPIKPICARSRLKATIATPATAIKTNQILNLKDILI